MLTPHSFAVLCYFFYCFVTEVLAVFFKRKLYYNLYKSNSKDHIFASLSPQISFLTCIFLQRGPVR